MIFYLTFNDAPSGIFSSQVIDTVRFFQSDLKKNTRLVSFLSIRSFYKNRRLILKDLPDAIVIPMFPGVQRWRINRFVLRFLHGYYSPDVIMARGVLATQLALMTTCDKVIYDGRGAIAEEWREYKVVSNPKLLQEIFQLEEDTVLKSHKQLAVSRCLVNYWQIQFRDFNSANAVVIPCTVNRVFESVSIDSNFIDELRAKMNFTKQDCVLVYSGSHSPWQSFQLLDGFITGVLLKKNNVKVLFLSDENMEIKSLKTRFPGRVFSIQVAPKDVPNYLIMGDFGLMLREQSITNRVASPVKTAEYLVCGLKVIITEKLGDFSEFVLENQCGMLVSDAFELARPSIEEKKRIQSLALLHFTKTSHLDHYRMLIS